MDASNTRQPESSRPDTPRYYRICPHFWKDERVLLWSDDQKLLALHILTSPHRTPEGIFTLPLSYLVADMRWTSKKVQKAIDRLISDDFILFDVTTNLMLIRNALKYQVPENPNQSKAVMRRVKDLPFSPLLSEFKRLAEQYCYRKGAGPAAQAFYSSLSEVLTQRLAQRLAKQKSESLTLPPTPTKTKNTKTHNSKAPALARELETPEPSEVGKGGRLKRTKTDEEHLPDFLREVEDSMEPIGNGMYGLRRKL